MQSGCAEVEVVELPVDSVLEHYMTLLERATGRDEPVAVLFVAPDTGVESPGALGLAVVVACAAEVCPSDHMDSRSVVDRLVSECQQAACSTHLAVERALAEVVLEVAG